MAAGLTMRIMRSQIPLLLVSSAILAPVWAGDWQVRSDIPYHVYGQAAAALQGRVHVLGGCHTPDWQKPGTAHQVYDPASDAWSTRAELPRENAWGMPAVHGGRIYLFGGSYYKTPQGLTSTDEAWVYDPATDRWTAIRKLPEPRMNGFASAVGPYIYISLGYNRQGGAKEGVLEEYRSTWRYDPASDTYTRVADAPATGCYVASGAYRDKVYAVPGSHREYGFHGDYVWADGALVYDPAANRWTKLDAPRVSKRVFFLVQCSASAIADGKLWIVGGMAENRQRTILTEYLDLEKGVFVKGPDVPFPRCCGGGGIVGNTLVITGRFIDGKGLGAPALPTWTLEIGGPQR
jgi:N-acetylneuraminic acid mutarotase